jgi:hypothetical protein
MELPVAKRTRLAERRDGDRQTEYGLRGSGASAPSNRGVVRALVDSAISLPTVLAGMVSTFIFPKVPPYELHAGADFTVRTRAGGYGELVTYWIYLRQAPAVPPNIWPIFALPQNVLATYNAPAFIITSFDPRNVIETTVAIDKTALHPTVWVIRLVGDGIDTEFAYCADDTVFAQRVQRHGIPQVLEYYYEDSDNGDGAGTHLWQQKVATQMR